MGGVFLPVDRFTAGDLMSVCDKTEQAGRKGGDGRALSHGWSKRR